MQARSKLESCRSHAAALPSATPPVPDASGSCIHDACMNLTGESLSHYMIKALQEFWLNTAGAGHEAIEICHRALQGQADAREDAARLWNALDHEQRARVAHELDRFCILRPDRDVLVSALVVAASPTRGNGILPSSQYLGTRAVDGLRHLGLTHLALRIEVSLELEPPAALRGIVATEREVLAAVQRLGRAPAWCGVCAAVALYRRAVSDQVGAAGACGDDKRADRIERLRQDLVTAGDRRDAAWCDEIEAELRALGAER